MKTLTLIKEPLEKMKNIQQTLLNFLDDETNDEINFQNLINYFDEQKISENEILFNNVLTMISKISYNHHRNQYFIIKIEQILKSYEGKMKQYFTNFYIFNIFKRNKRILLYLFKENILTPDEEIFAKIKKGKYARMNYLQYFYPEFKSFCDIQLINQIEEENPELINLDLISFDEKRKIGENDGYIYHLIRNDLIDEFIVYFNKTNIPLDMIVQPSIFETNPYLMERLNITLIDYSIFFGSIQIFRFLRLNKIECNHYSWFFVIHSNNSELIHILEENIELIFKDLVINESIKCHHNDIMNYILDNHVEKEEIIKENHLLLNFQYHNFLNINENLMNDIDESKLLIYLCKYSCWYIVDYLLKNSSIDVNVRHIYCLYLLNKIHFLEISYHFKFKR